MNRYCANRSRGATPAKLAIFAASAAIILIICIIIFYPFLGLSKQSNDVNVEKDLSAMRSQAELYYANAETSSYGIIADGTPCIHAVNASQTVFSGTAGLRDLIKFTNIDGGFSLTCASGPTSWSVIVTLPSETSNWCVDEKGNSKSVPVGTLATSRGC